MNNQLIEEFIVFIRKEVSVIDDLISVGLTKQKTLIANNIEQLNIILNEENALIADFNRLESGRYQIQEQLASFYNMTASAATATGLTPKIKSDYNKLAADLEEVITQLNKAVTRLREVNRHNDELVGFSLDYLDYLRTIYEGDVAGVYSCNGQPTDGRTYLNGLKMLDWKV
ncbi:MAG: flagellar protein FlgN [Syntrophomonadaceae bacterium]|jgi:flagellar biosynthesis/type III secretory pathway chaperone|nr:flagellar protein FlgN [Syntrophomonadaceae bacterium]